MLVLFLCVNFIFRSQACSYKCAKGITMERHFSDVLIILRDFKVMSYFSALKVFSCAIRYSTYSFIVRFVSFALFLMSSWSFSVTVMHL
jgi:hypothetical protein